MSLQNKQYLSNFINHYSALETIAKKKDPNWIYFILEDDALLRDNYKFFDSFV